MTDFSRNDFGSDFIWGVSTSAYQIEGAHNKDGKGPSIWDEFTNKGKAYKKQTGNLACDFYHRYEEDIELMAKLGIKNFRFSISWSRIFPNGKGEINQKGVAFYHQVIDTCLKNNIQPWITLYHWDLPLALEKKGGWSNREIIHWFNEYASFIIKTYGDKVKKWMVLNEPLVYTGAGYFIGEHAPGYRSLNYFLKALHHTAIVQGSTPKLLRSFYSDLEIGTTFSCSHLEPITQHKKHILATERADYILNHLLIDLLSGNGYDFNKFKAIQRIQKHIQPGDLELMQGNYDFIGVQNYTREIIKHTWYIPYLKAKIISAPKRKVPHTDMNWEVYPESIYHMLKKFDALPTVKNIIITENGAAFNDTLDKDGKIRDVNRKEYFQNYLKQVLRAKKEGVNVNGYFIWSFTDNFEWAEGYRPRFGIVHVDFETQKRTVKHSGEWYSKFLTEN